MPIKNKNVQFFSIGLSFLGFFRFVLLLNKLVNFSENKTSYCHFASQVNDQQQ